MKNLVSKFETKSSETQNLTKSSKKIRDGECGGVKPRPTIKAQEHRFIKSTPEEEKSLGHHVGNTGA